MGDQTEFMLVSKRKLSFCLFIVLAGTLLTFAKKTSYILQHFGVEAVDHL
jgi:hypothetical protein